MYKWSPVVWDGEKVSCDTKKGLGHPLSWPYICHIAMFLVSCSFAATFPFTSINLKSFLSRAAWLDIRYHGLSHDKKVPNSSHSTIQFTTLPAVKVASFWVMFLYLEFSFLYGLAFWIAPTSVGSVHPCDSGKMPAFLLVSLSFCFSVSFFQHLLQRRQVIKPGGEIGLESPAIYVLYSHVQ